MKDLIIIGAGPAGITAAIYAARKKMDFTMISIDLGGQAAWSGDVENYTGTQLITGPELALKFTQHMKQFKVDLKQGDTVTSIKKTAVGFVVTTNSSIYEAKTLVIASGKKPRMLNVSGEAEFKNKGVTYCATCDGPIFAGKPVAIIGGGNSALDAAIQMVRIASKTYIINAAGKITGDPVMLDKLKGSADLEIMNSAKVLSISGDKFVNRITVNVNGTDKDLPVEGVFIEIGLLPNADFIDIVNKNKLGEIMVNGSAETSQPGIFAAGDVTDVPEKQIIIAAGEGAKAALSAFRYLSTH